MPNVPMALLPLFRLVEVLELPSRVAATIAAVCPTEPAEVIATVPVPAPMVLLMSILPDVVVFSVTLPLFVVMPVTPPAVPTAKLWAVSLNAKASPAFVRDAAIVPTALAAFRVIDPLLPLAASAAAAMVAVCPMVPAEVIARVPVPAPMVLLMSMLPDVVVLSVTLPLLVAMPVTPPAVPTTRFFAVSLNAKPEPAFSSDAATVPMALSAFNVTD